MISRIIRVIMFFTFLVSSNLFADSDGVVGFGDDFVAYTSFSKNGAQSLNVVSFKDGGSFYDVVSTALPVSYSEIVIKNNLIFVLWHTTLFVYEFKEHTNLNLLKKFVVSGVSNKKILNSRYSILPYKNRILIFTKNGTSSLNIDDEVSEWRIEEVTQVETVELSDRRKNEHGDWVPRYGTCLNKSGYIYCLAYSVSSSAEENGSLVFYDKLLVTKSHHGATNIVLPINSRYETIH